MAKDSGEQTCTIWEYAMVQVKGEASDAGLLAGLNDMGKLGWDVVSIRPDGKPYQSLSGMVQKWSVIGKRPQRAIVPANELEGLDLVTG